MMKYDQAKTQQVKCALAAMATTPPVIPPWAEIETQMFDNKLWTLTALFHHLKDTKLIRKSEHYALQVTERVGSSRKLIR
ncbi:hypothetical protein, partial [Neoaquamicrobium sediminum]|uniref:hypothetical protein n=1 Tax=Neoaquamicrobium sediminum TaxID=1849104 RepID=UPI0040363097